MWLYPTVQCKRVVSAIPAVQAVSICRCVYAGIGIERNARYWSDAYQIFLSQNVVPGLLPARQSYVSVTEMESRMAAVINSYDQYEVSYSCQNQ